MVNAPALNLVVVLLAALWLPTGPCCAIASASTSETSPSAPLGENTDPAGPSPCPAPSPCGGSNTPASPQDKPEPADEHVPCHAADECDCPSSMSAHCARTSANDAAILITAPQPLIPGGAIDAALADLYPPTFPAGRLAIDVGRPEPAGTSTLLQLGCMLTT